MFLNGFGNRQTGIVHHNINASIIQASLLKQGIDLITPPSIKQKVQINEVAEEKMFNQDGKMQDE